jgi:NhaP-type Na+/H+ or K+/H+ antiporter
MSTDQVLLGVGLIVVLAVGSQVLASRLRIPALIILLPAGFTAGALTTDVNPQRLLGAAFQPLVSLAVAVILYDSGLALEWGTVTGRARRVVPRLVIWGVPITMAFAAVLAGPLLGMSAGAAVMTGAILVVSGPTVVGPLLAFVRPADRLQRILSWEGSLIDPVGGILGAVVFHAVLASTHGGIGHPLGQFLLSVGIGAVGAAVGVAVLWFCLCQLDLDDVLGTTAQLAAVIGVAAACDIVRDDAGLIAAILMGLAVANLRAFDVPARRPFFETLVQLIIGVLFVSISATVTPASLKHIVLPSLGLVAVLVVVTRPLVAFLATIRTELTRGERAFTGWMAPRGIIAAATASTFGAELAASHIGGASKILPVTFLVIVATVAIYGLTAVPVARRLGVTRPARSRPLLIGGDLWVIDLARALRTVGLEVLMWAPSGDQRTQIQQAALELAPGEQLASAIG